MTQQFFKILLVLCMLMIILYWIFNSMSIRFIELLYLFFCIRELSLVPYPMLRNNVGQVHYYYGLPWRLRQWCSPGFDPGWERAPAEGNSNPLQYSCLENSMDRREWWVQSIGPQRIEHNWVTNPFTFFTFRSIIILPSLHVPAPYWELPKPYFPSFLGLSARLRFTESHSSLFYFLTFLNFILSSLLFFFPSPFLFLI